MVYMLSAPRTPPSRVPNMWFLKMMTVKYKEWDTQLGIRYDLSSWFCLWVAVWPWRLHSHATRSPFSSLKWEVSDFLSSLQLWCWFQQPVLSEPREPSFHHWGQPGKAPPLTDLIGLFTSWCRCCFGCLVTQWWRLPVPRGEMNEWAEIFTLGAVATARAAHCRFRNSTCLECFSYNAGTAA